MLPKIKTKKDKIIAEMENQEKLKENYNPFKSKMEKVLEIKIFLKYNFTKNDIDNQFINDLEQEYAIQFLEKMEYLPSKQNIDKLLKLRPLELCDFHLSQEEVRNKTAKLVHIYPNNKMEGEKKGREKLKRLLTNDEMAEIIHENYKLNYKENEVQKIKRREIKRDELMLFQREHVDNMISGAKDDILDKQLYSKNEGMNDKNLLSIENIRNKYLNPNAKNILEKDSDEKMTAKAKFQNISNAYKRDVLSDEKYKFKFLEIQLNKDVLDEVNKPIEVPVEIIMKDINFILDNFPIEELVDIDNKEDIQMKTDRLYKTAITTFKETTTNKQLYYKIKSVRKEDITYVYKKIQTNKVFKIVGLTVNLIYWIVFGYINRFQIDQSTKQFMFFKLLQEINTLESGFKNKKLFIKIYMPLLILIVRIECENIFNKNFKILFDDPKNKSVAMAKINELVTVIYDPHAYYNTFTIIGGNTALLKHKLNKKILPQYKAKTFVTSNFVDQLFTNYKAQKNLFIHRDREREGLAKDFDIGIWEHEKKYIAESKTKFFGVVFQKINQRLKKRNLEPVFSVKKDLEVNKAETDINT